MKKAIRPLLTITTLALATLTLPAVAAQLQGQEGAEMTAVSAQDQTIEATGTVKAINAQAAMITLAHGPIEALSWPAMTMPFKVADRALLQDIKIGDEVRFTLQGPKHVVTVLEKAEG